MKFLVAFAVLIVCAAAFPGDRDAQVIEDERDIFPNGSHHSRLRIDNGIEQNAEGELVQVDGAKRLSPKVTGSFILFDAEGKPHLHTYIADENGYRVTGPLVPQAA